LTMPARAEQIMTDTRRSFRHLPWWTATCRSTPSLLCPRRTRPTALRRGRLVAGSGYQRRGFPRERHRHGLIPTVLFGFTDSRCSHAILACLGGVVLSRRARDRTATATARPEKTGGGSMTERRVALKSSPHFGTPLRPRSAPVPRLRPPLARSPRGASASRRRIASRRSGPRSPTRETALRRGVTYRRESVADVVPSTPETTALDVSENDSDRGEYNSVAGGFQEGRIPS
jgi:hypothetical protein